MFQGREGGSIPKSYSAGQYVQYDITKGEMNFVKGINPRRLNQLVNKMTGTEVKLKLKFYFVFHQYFKL